MEQRRVVAPLRYVARQSHEEAPAGPSIVEYDRRDVDPEARTGSGPNIEVEVGNPADRLRITDRCFISSNEWLGA